MKHNNTTGVQGKTKHDKTNKDVTMPSTAWRKEARQGKTRQENPKIRLGKARQD
jgi:hypothetical protein